MEYYKMKYTNGILMIPEYTIDNVFDKIYIEFECFGEDFPVRGIDIFNCSCSMEIVKLFEVLLSTNVKKLWQEFLRCIGGIILVSETYRIKFSKFNFSNGIIYREEKKSVIYNVENLDIEFKYLLNIYPSQCYIISYYDIQKKNVVENKIMNLLDYESFEQLRENPDEQFEKHIKRIIALWERLNCDIENQILKMKLMGILVQS